MSMNKQSMSDDQLGLVSGGTKIPYVVQPGDSIASVAKKYHVTEEQIRRWNNIPVGGMLAVNQTLIIKF